MEDKLKEIFSNVNDWLKYSETKNGVLLTLNGGVILGILSQMKDTTDSLLPYVKWLTLPFFTISLIILMISFLPIRDKFFKRTFVLSSQKLSELNLLFYGDLKCLTANIFLKKLYEANGQALPASYSKNELDYANQILNNSGITDRKLTLFTIATTIDLIGIVICIILMFI
jgi:hypothetical protein